MAETFSRSYFDHSLNEGNPEIRRITFFPTLLLSQLVVSTVAARECNRSWRISRAAQG